MADFSHFQMTYLVDSVLQLSKTVCHSDYLFIDVKYFDFTDISLLEEGVCV